MNRLDRSRFLQTCGGISVAGVAAGRTTARAAAYTMRMNVSQPSESAQSYAAQHFAAAVARRSNGQLTIEVYPSGQLARELDSVNGLISGVIDFTAVSSSLLVSFSPRFDVLTAPFLCRNSAAAFRLVDGPIGTELFADLEPRGITCLCWGGGSMRELETISKPVVTPEDMKGLRIRILGGTVFTEIFRALGAVPVVVDIAETFTALQQRTIDGLELPINSFVAGKYFTVAKNAAMLNHSFSIDPVMGSRRKIEALPRALQDVIHSAAREVPAFWRGLIAKQATSDLQTLKTQGVAVTEIQYPAFRKAMEPVYTMMQARLGGDLLDRVRRAAGA